MVCGMSRSGSVSFGVDRLVMRPVTSTDSLTLPDFDRHADPERRKVRLVPSSTRVDRLVDRERAGHAWRMHHRHRVGGDLQIERERRPARRAPSGPHRAGLREC